MKPDWDKLGDEYASSPSVLIADVDCTKEDELCKKHEVRGYPTIKYFTADTGKSGADYRGGREFDALKEFVEENLETKCDVNALPGKCTEKELGYIEKMKGSAKDALESALQRLEKMQSGKMTPELKGWLNQRIAILKQLLA